MASSALGNTVSEKKKLKQKRVKPFRGVRQSPSGGFNFKVKRCDHVLSPSILSVR